MAAAAVVVAYINCRPRRHASRETGEYSLGVGRVGVSPFNILPRDKFRRLAKSSANSRVYIHVYTQHSALSNASFGRKKTRQ